MTDFFTTEDLIFKLRDFTYHQFTSLPLVHLWISGWHSLVGNRPIKRRKDVHAPSVYSVVGIAHSRVACIDMCVSGSNIEVEDKLQYFSVTFFYGSHIHF